jgi:ABC-type antimicrobial peptide transport system permease subunit
MLATIARSLDPEVFPDVQILKTAFDRKLQNAGRSALAVSLLGLCALLLACLGIAGLVAYAVSQRVKEIGIRLALGAARGHILALVLRQFSRPVIAGLIAGIAGAAGLSQILRRQLYGISALDPEAYLAAIAIFLLTVATAALWPARRALRIDPLRALRHD